MNKSALKRLFLSPYTGVAILLLALAAGALWLTYGAGQLAGAREQALRATEAGALSWNEAFPRVLSSGRQGRLFIGEENALFSDGAGHKWNVVGFRDHVTQAQLADLQKAQVAVEGKVETTIEPARIGSAQIAVASYANTVGRAALGLMEVALALVAVWLMVKMAGRGDMFGMRFTRATKSEQKTRFDDVAGHSGPKHEVREIVEYLKHPERFQRTGARVPTGVLLYGPPGNGKTLLAKAIAGEADAEFLEQNASSFVQLYVGAGAMAVRGLFKQARKKRPCVIFIDEIDAVGGHRGGGSGSHDERLQTLNALLAELDGFGGRDGIVVIAATNRLEDLDQALVRPGRFDRKIMVGQPGRGDRQEILQAHARKVPSLTADLEKWALQTQGFSGADLANLVNEAAIEAARHGKDTVTDADFALARDRVLLGPKNPGHRLSSTENRVIAYHETGHAVVRSLKGSGRVNRVSILPRGRSLGVTISEMAEDELLHTRQRVHEELLVLMAGRAAEEVFCGRVSSGAGNDMERASQLARQAMKTFGFGEFGPYIPEHEALLADIERAAARWVNEAYAEAVLLMRQHQAAVHRIADELIKCEEIDGDVVEAALEEANQPAKAAA